MLFHYLEGTYTIADLKPLLSRSRRNTNTQNDNEDSNIHDVVNKLTNKGINPNNSFVLATILELKQSFNENIQSTGDKLETLSKKFEDENKMLKQEIMSKESEITQLKAALQEENTLMVVFERILS
jgi:septin family protein